VPDASASVLFVIGLAVAAVAFVLLVFAANSVLSPRKPTAEKAEPFECGMPQIGEPHTPLRLRFAVIAVLFVLFDAESVLLFAVASRLRGSGAGSLAVLGFVAFLGFGLLYAWRKGVLQWR
jgi:NADH-quinone oxidoreductase subunit A